MHFAYIYALAPSLWLLGCKELRRHLIWRGRQRSLKHRSSPARITLIYKWGITPEWLMNISKIWRISLCQSCWPGLSPTAPPFSLSLTPPPTFCFTLAHKHKHKIRFSAPEVGWQGLSLFNEWATSIHQHGEIIGLPRFPFCTHYSSI